MDAFAMTTRQRKCRSGDLRMEVILEFAASAITPLLNDNVIDLISADG
jgi:hypothetical protein